jgi:hypothetical protein
MFKPGTDKYLQYDCRTSQQALTSSSFLSLLLKYVTPLHEVISDLDWSNMRLAGRGLEHKG